jgi:hypothetical protein
MKLFISPRLRGCGWGLTGLYVRLGTFALLSIPSLTQTWESAARPERGHSVKVHIGPVSDILRPDFTR